MTEILGVRPVMILKRWGELNFLIGTPPLKDKKIPSQSERLIYRGTIRGRKEV